MRLRRGLGLPLLYNDSGDDLEPGLRAQLEEGLLRACREVGTLLLGEGRIREGWMYFRPLGDRVEVARLLGGIQETDGKVEELIEVMLHEGVDVPRGFQLVLKHYGTCNAITTFESVLTRHAPRDQRAAAGMLVEHVHRELLASLVADIARQEGSAPAERTLAELLARRPAFLGEYTYHIDTTHLASTVRCARILEDASQLRLAWDLTQYGRRLNRQFQYPGEEPFVDLYPSHGLYFAALLGEDVEQAVAYFEARAAEVDVERQGAQATEAYLQLLDRLGRFREAQEALLRFARRHETTPQQVLPLLLELAGKSGSFEPVLEFCRERHDLLGFATALIQSRIAHSARGPRVHLGGGSPST
jgi:hypothetical protein